MRFKSYQYIAFILLTVFLISGIMYFGFFNSTDKIARKPVAPEQQGKNQDQKYKWYIKFSVKDQKSTAYTEEPYAPAAANGLGYFIGGVAVHPQYPLQSGGEATIPIIPFGTKIHLIKPLTVQGEQIKSFTVIDTGDVYYSLWPNYHYWFDIYFGSTNYSNIKNARAYGADLVDYYWYEPWK